MCAIIDMVVLRNNKSRVLNPRQNLRSVKKKQITRFVHPHAHAHVIIFTWGIYNRQKQLNDCGTMPMFLTPCSNTVVNALHIVPFIELTITRQLPRPFYCIPGVPPSLT